MRPTTRLMSVAGLALLLVSASCASDALLGPEAPQGIEGLVLIGPQCPVQSLEDPCPDLPHQATIDVRDSDDGWVTQVRSGANGTFRVGLRPGMYTLHPRSGDPFPTAVDVDVEVLPGQYAQVTISFDTGIR
jgi:hypothetical protein